MSVGRILVVEDDHGLRDVLARGLRAQGFDVFAAADGAVALHVVGAGSGASASSSFDVIVLDIGLPDSDGRDVCQALRSRGIDAPVIFLTARGSVGDRVSGFGAGGDDYLAKPFAFAELTARLRALLRRRVVAADDRDLHLDPVTHRLRHGAHSVRLSPTEFRLLARLLSGGEEVVRRAALRAAAWPDGAIVSDNTLDQYMTKLRRRLSEVEAPTRIGVVRGVGFEIR